MDNNSIKYSSLKAKSLNKRKSVFEFDNVMNRIISEMAPVSMERKASPDKEPVLQDNSKQFKQLQKSQDDRFEQEEEKRNKTVEELKNQVDEGDDRNYKLSMGLKEALNRMAQSNSSQQKSEEVSQTEGIENPESTNETDSSVEDSSALPESRSYSYTPEASSIGDTPVYSEPEATSAPAPVAKVIRQVVKIGDAVKVGENIYKVTNLFGPRTGANSVAGRDDGEHSRGIDIVGYSKDGSVSNLPIALADGKIIGINVQGDGSVIKPKDGKSAGYYMSVQMNDGKVMNYMHLGKDVFKNKASLLGKNIKRGDVLYEGDYSKGSGSQTGPHIKVSISSVNNKGELNKDYTKEENDPTPYMLFGKYVPEEKN